MRLRQIIRALEANLYCHIMSNVDHCPSTHMYRIAFRHNYPPSRTLIKWQWQQKQQEDEEEEAKRKITITLNRQPLVQWSNFT